MDIVITARNGDKNTFATRDFIAPKDKSLPLSIINCEGQRAFFDFALEDILNSKENMAQIRKIPQIQMFLNAQLVETANNGRLDLSKKLLDNGAQLQGAFGIRMITMSLDSCDWVKKNMNEDAFAALERYIPQKPQSLLRSLIGAFKMQ